MCTICHSQGMETLHVRRTILPGRWAYAPSVKHEQQALAAAGLPRLEAPFTRALRERTVAAPLRSVPAHPLLQAHLAKLLH